MEVREFNIAAYRQICYWRRMAALAVITALVAATVAVYCMTSLSLERSRIQLDLSAAKRLRSTK